MFLHFQFSSSEASISLETTEPNQTSACDLLQEKVYQLDQTKGTAISQLLDHHFVGPIETRFTVWFESQSDSFLIDQIHIMLVTKRSQFKS